MRSKEELIDMIQSTITSNGARNITGSILQEVLLEIVDSMGSAGSGGGGGGASAALVFIDSTGTTETCTADQIQNNATVFASIKTATLNGTCIPAVYVRMTSAKGDSYVGQYMTPLVLMYTPESSEYPEMVAIMTVNQISENLTLLLPDGTVLTELL